MFSHMYNFSNNNLESLCVWRCADQGAEGGSGGIFWRHTAVPVTRGSVAHHWRHRHEWHVQSVPCHLHYPCGEEQERWCVSGCELEKLRQLCIRLFTVVICFISVNGSGLGYLSELLHVYTPSCTVCSSSDTCMLKIQQNKHKTWVFHTFSYFGPHI